MSTKMYNFENALEKINRDIVRLSKEEVMINTQIQLALLDILIKHMKQVDDLFATLYCRVFYGGSYYDGLKVSKPDEYDLDLLLNLNKVDVKPVLIHEPEYPGHVRILASSRPGLYAQKLSCWFDDSNRLIAEKVRSWMEGVLTKALNKAYCPNTTDIVVGSRKLKVTMKKSGPAHTLLVSGCNGLMSIDLVPCFVFKMKDCPVKLTHDVSTKQEFFVVPKNPPYQCTLWRLSFQEQERVIINGKNKLKPALKLMKRLRDNKQHCKIASYFLKTIFLWECITRDERFWNRGSLSFVFMEMMKTYKACLSNYNTKNHIVTYYWDPKYDLLGKENQATIENIHNSISRIIQDIETKNDDDVIFKYLGGQTSSEQCNIPPVLLDMGVSFMERLLLGDDKKQVLQSTNSNEQPGNQDANCNGVRQEPHSSGVSWWKITGVVLGGIAAVTTAAAIAAASYSSDDVNENAGNRRQSLEENERRENRARNQNRQ